MWPEAGETTGSSVGSPLIPQTKDISYKKKISENKSKMFHRT